MDLYVANLTQQNQDFTYRLPEAPANRSQLIQPGTQIRISGDLDTQAIDAIIKQHAIYGLVDVAKVRDIRAFSGLCYSIGKAVPATAIMLGLERNNAALQERGKKMREEAAIATNQFIEDAVQQNARNGLNAQMAQLEMSVQEDVPDANAEPDHEVVAEGVRVTRRAQGDQPRPAKRARRG